MSEKPQKSSKAHWIGFTLSYLLLSGGLCFAVVYMYQEISGIKQTQIQQYNRHCETNQLLLSTIDWDTRRTKKTLFMRDRIVAEWRRIGEPIEMEKAFLIAEANLRECEFYGYIDPFLVLAMQYVESSFRKEAVSKMGALGLNQIMPATGALLSVYFGQQYTDSLLFDIVVSTKLAVKLLDVSYGHYERWDLVLAAYNGGPWQAYYFQSEKSKLVQETALYVPAVLSKWKEYQKRYKTYEVNKEIKSR